MRYPGTLLILFLCFSLIGCSDEPRKPKDLPRLFSCTITITQESEPLAGAIVLLVPDDGSTDWFVAGFTDASGVANMRASSLWDGAPSGIYKVVVTKTYVEPSNIPPLPDDADDAARERHEIALDGERRGMYALVEPEFSAAATTPLTLTVDGRTNVTLDVGQKVRIRR